MVRIDPPPPHHPPSPLFHYHVARPRLTRELHLLDLRGNGAMWAGSVAALAKIADYAQSQAWSRYFYEHENVYTRIDGLTYLNAHKDLARSLRESRECTDIPT